MLDRADRLYQKLNNVGGKAHIRQLLSKYHISFEKWSEAHDRFDDAIVFRKRERNQAKLVDTFCQIIDNYEKAGQPEIAKEYRNKAVQFDDRAHSIVTRGRSRQTRTPNSI